MIEVKIPSEIRDYKGKVFAGLNVRQIIAIGGALAVAVPIVLLGKGKISADVLPWLVIVSVAPFAGWGFMTYKGMRFEEFMRVLFDFHFMPQKRVYEDADVNFLSDLKDGIVCADVIQQRIENGELDEDDLDELDEEYEESEDNI